MEAKDTVMGKKKIQELTGHTTSYEPADTQISYSLNTIKQLLKTQAEISFKGGMEEEARGGHNSISYLEGLRDGDKQRYDIGVEDGKVEGVAEGIREVVEWIQKNHRLEPEEGGVTVSQTEWQAKLKEWGIDESNQGNNQEH